MAYVQYEMRGSAGIVTLYGPKNLNALSAERILELTNFLSSLESELMSDSPGAERTSGLRALILTGYGKSFIAGADIKEMRGMSRDAAATFCEAGLSLMRRIEGFPVPVIAAVNGHALGGGMETALAADFIFAAAGATFGLPEVTIGIMPGFGGIRRLTQRIGAAKAKELVFTGRVINAEEAKAIGIVNRITDDSSLLNAALDVVEEITRAAPGGLRAAKNHFAVCAEGASDDDRGAIMQSELRAFSSLFEGSEPSIGMSAFIEKRKPEWT